MPGGDGDLDARIDAVEAWYAARDLPPVFKLTDAADPKGLDAALAARGYTTDGETLSMSVRLGHVLRHAPTFVLEDAVTDLFAGRVRPGWFDASCRLSGIPDDERDDYRAILERCLETQSAVLFCGVLRAGEIVSVAMGSVVEDAVSLVAVATDAAHRGQRLAESALRTIVFAAREHGARSAILNVEAPNHPARRLYERMGFEARYRYWYRERA
ncbi:MAG: GNAT family N-acetyltransferase [Myxococcota bacterium]